MSELAGKRVVVVGLGASGVAAVRLCLRLGARVVASDGKALGSLSGEARALEAQGATLVAGGHAEARMHEADVIVVSPGVPALAEIEAAGRQGIPVWGEVELAVRSMAHPAPVVAIGGTNGKSTTTSLVGALLEASGRRVFVGGNLLWYPVEGDNTIRQAPDALVAFERPRGHRGSYRQWEEGGIAPHVVFEILSPGNRFGQMLLKFQFYERYRVEEYYVYDPDRDELFGWLRNGDRLQEIAKMDSDGYAIAH